MAKPSFMAKLPPLTRLDEPSFDEEVAPVYARALEFMGAEGAPYLLGGALAFNHYTGIWRDTKDLDVFCKPEDAGRVLGALERAGFDTEVVYESWLGKGWKGDVFVDVIWRNANGLFPVTDAWFDDVGRKRLLGHDVPVLPVDKLILSKIMVGGRYRFDGADVLHLLHAAHDRIDWGRLIDGAGEHVGLLTAYLHMYRWGYPGWADRVPESVLARCERRAREVESSYGPFRALLMDIQSFRVDVEGWNMPDPHRQALLDIFGEWEGRQ